VRLDRLASLFNLRKRWNRAREVSKSKTAEELFSLLRKKEENGGGKRGSQTVAPMDLMHTSRQKQGNESRSWNGATLGPSEREGG